LSVTQATQVAAALVLPVGQVRTVMRLAQSVSQTLAQLEEVQSSTTSDGEAHTVPPGAVHVHVHMAPQVFGVPPLPQVLGGVQVSPQLSVPPQPSEIVPQSAPSAVHAATEDGTELSPVILTTQVAQPLRAGRGTTAVAVEGVPPAHATQDTGRSSSCGPWRRGRRRRFRPRGTLHPSYSSFGRRWVG